MGDGGVGRVEGVLGVFAPGTGAAVAEVQDAAGLDFGEIGFEHFCQIEGVGGRGIFIVHGGNRGLRRHLAGGAPASGTRRALCVASAKSLLRGSRGPDDSTPSYEDQIRPIYYQRPHSGIVSACETSRVCLHRALERGEIFPAEYADGAGESRQSFRHSGSHADDQFLQDQRRVDDGRSTGLWLREND